MKSASLLLMTLVLLLALPYGSARAESVDDWYNEQLEASGANTLYDALPSETKALIDRIGWSSLSLDAVGATQPQTVFSALGEWFSGEASVPLSAATTVLTMMLFLGFCATLQPTVGEQNATFRVIGMLVTVTPLLLPLWRTYERTAAAVDSASVFSLAFAPVYAAILSAQGSAVTAVSYQTIMLAAAEGISVMVGNVVLPLTATAFALNVGGAVDPRSRLSDVGGLFHRAAVWLIGIALTIFVGMLSLQSVLAASADSVSGRVLRFSVAGFVPIVGGHLAEALYTVRGCLSALKGSVGGFGVLCTLLIVLPTMLECIAWNVLMSLSKTAASLFSLAEISAVIEAAQKTVKALIAVLASLALLMIVSVTVVTMAGGGSL